MANKKINIILLTLISLFLVVPLVFLFTNVNKNIPLKGDVVLNQNPDFTISGWTEGSFQGSFEKYINDNIGFRPWFVRVRNQVAFSLYGRLNAAYVIRGKEDYLYETNYISAYNGDDFVGEDTIRYKTERIKLLQDSLQKMGKSLIVCFAPGKGSFYAEYFPDEYVKPKTSQTNYKVYRKYFDETGVNYIDFNQWFLQMKDTSRYILYPRYGIHWSNYGMLLATDSLISYIEKLRNTDLPDLQMKNFKLTKKLNDSDYDIADGLNVVFRLPVDEMCYPEISWEDSTGKQKPRVIVISDSFYWSMYGTGVSKNSFSEGGFWYYNKQIYPESFNSETTVNQVNHWEVIHNTDVFVILATEATLPGFPWRFTENSLAAFAPGYSEHFNNTVLRDIIYNKELQHHIAVIKNDENWMKVIEQKATEMGISVDSMLVIDAKWIIENKPKQ